MKPLQERLRETSAFIKDEMNIEPRIGIILGTGLGALSKQIKEAGELSYERLPHFPVSTVPGHAGRLIWGALSHKPVVAFAGRFHYYEGWPSDAVVFCVRVMKALGVEVLIVSNASGGLNPLYEPGDLMLITDHINLMGLNPLIGPNDETLGPRFPDMSEPYSQKLIKLTEETALAEKIKLKKGVYVAVPGPNLETRAEYRFLRTIGADAVGMSTVPEVIVAVHSGLKVLGLSCITDSCLPDALKVANIDEIIKVANSAEPKLTRLVEKVVENIDVK